MRGRDGEKHGGKDLCSDSYKPEDNNVRTVLMMMMLMDSRVLVPLAQELLSLRFRPGLLRVYLVGSVLALLGVVVGVADMLRLTFCTEDVQTGPEEQYEELLATLREITHTHSHTDTHPHTDTHSHTDTHTYSELRPSLHFEEEREGPLPTGDPWNTLPPYTHPM